MVKNMEEIKFNSLNELYQRLLPALKTRQKELTAGGLSYVMPEDIWNFLKENKWLKSANLSLHDMVNDIMLVDIHDIEYYIKKQMKHVKRDLIPDEGDIL